VLLNDRIAFPATNTLPVIGAHQYPRGSRYHCDYVLIQTLLLYRNLHCLCLLFMACFSLGMGLKMEITRGLPYGWLRVSSRRDNVFGERFMVPISIHKITME